MGAMKNWAAVLGELAAAREHWEQCNHARGMACRAELEAHIRLERAKADHMAEVKRFLNAMNDADHHADAPEASQDAPGTPTGGECEETCAECGKAVSEGEYADTPRGEPVLHDACRPLHAAWRREQEAEWRADDVMFGEGRGSL